MIEIVNGTLEEQIIKILQKQYPITISQLVAQLHSSRDRIIRELQKLQTKGIVLLEPLPHTTFIRLLRHDFRFIGKRRQKKFIKHYSSNKKEKPKDYEGFMYS